jgi:HEAT repeat protein
MQTLILIGIGLAAPPAPMVANRPVADWVRDLDDKDPLVQEEALEVLAGAAQAAKEAVPRLEKLTREGPLPLRLRAGLALWRVTGQTAPATGLLAETLRQSASAAIRTQALQSLQQLGPAGAPAVPAVVDLLEDSEQVVRVQAQATLERVGSAAMGKLLEGA